MEKWSMGVDEAMLVKVDGVLQPRMVAMRPKFFSPDGTEHPLQPVPEVREGELLVEYMDRPPEIHRTR